METFNKHAKILSWRENFNQNLRGKKKKRVCSIKTVRIRMGVSLERKRDPVDTLSWRNKGIVKHSVDRIEGI